MKFTLSETDWPQRVKKSCYTKSSHQLKKTHWITNGLQPLGYEEADDKYLDKWVAKVLMNKGPQRLFGVLGTNFQ